MCSRERTWTLAGGAESGSEFFRTNVRPRLPSASGNLDGGLKAYGYFSCRSR